MKQYIYLISMISTFESTIVRGRNVGYVLHRDLFLEQMWGMSSIKLKLDLFMEQVWDTSSIELKLNLSSVQRR